MSQNKKCPPVTPDDVVTIDRDRFFLSLVHVSSNDGDGIQVNSHVFGDADRCLVILQFMRKAFLDWYEERVNDIISKKVSVTNKRQKNVDI